MKTALLFGATGLVGGHVLNQLIQNNNYSKIKIFVRSSTQINMRLFDVEQAAQKEIVDDTPLFDRSSKPEFKDVFSDFK